MAKYFYLFCVTAVVGILTGCSLFQSFAKKETRARAAAYDYTYIRQAEDQGGWQSYDWHNDAELVRLHAIADSLIQLGEKVPDELQRKLHPRNYVETLVPPICNDIIMTAKNYLGCKYGSGRMGPDRFDCSGFTCYVYSFFDIVLGRSSRDQYLMGREIYDPRALQPADLVFWTGSNSKNQTVGHVGMVIDVNEDTGVFRFIHSATHTGITISSSNEEYYQKRYMGARRIIEYEQH